MGHAELLRRIESLPRSQRMAVEQLVDALAADANRSRNATDTERVLAEARASWPGKMSVVEIDNEVAAMRAEWEGRCWERPA